MSELTVHMLKCIVRGYVCCPLIHDSLFIHSFIQRGKPLGGFRQILPQKILKSWCSEMPFLDFWEDNFCLKCLLNQLSFFLLIFICVALCTITWFYFIFQVFFLSFRDKYRCFVFVWCSLKVSCSYPYCVLVVIWDFPAKVEESQQNQSGWTVCICPSPLMCHLIMLM